MAAPTPTTHVQWDGTQGYLYWRAEWTDGTQLTDSILVDVSDTATFPVPGAATRLNSVKVIGIECQCNGDLEATLEFDATTDQLIDVFEGQTDSTIVFSEDYTNLPSGGRVPNTTAAGFVGDILLTTVNAANGDELKLKILFRRKT